MRRTHTAHALRTLPHRKFAPRPIESSGPNLFLAASEEWSESLGAYIRDVRRVGETLTKDVENALIQQMRRGGVMGAVARDALIHANLRFVIECAKRYLGQGLPIPDLIQEGNLGLIRAVDLYDPTKANGGRLIAYAGWYVHRAILNAIIRTTGMVHVERDLARLLIRLRRLMKVMVDTLGRPPTSEEVAAEAKIPIEFVDEILQSSPRIIRFSPTEERGEDAFEGFDSEKLADPRSTPKEDLLDLLALPKLLQKISGQEDVILRYRFGLGDAPRMKLREIGAFLGISHERVRQIESVGMAKMRWLLGVGATRTTVARREVPPASGCWRCRRPVPGDIFCSPAHAQEWWVTAPPDNLPSEARRVAE